MKLRHWIKRIVITARDRVGTHAPKFLQQRFPPNRGKLVSVATWVNGENDPEDDCATLLYWDRVPTRKPRPPARAYPCRWEPFHLESNNQNDPLFVIGLKNGRVHGRFPVVLSASGNIVLEISRVHSEPIDSHPVYSFAVLPQIQRLKGRTLLLASAYGGSFYHWFVDDLPRLGLLDRALIDIDSFDHVLVPESTGPFFEESLNFFPELNGKIKTLSNTTHWECESLVCPSLLHPVGDADAWGPSFIRQRLLGRSRAVSGSRRLYISRALAGRRRLENESKLYHDVLAPRGFEFVTLERLALRDQAELFAEACIVVAPHGAGLTNLIYAPDKCTVIELLSKDYPAQCYWHLADELGLDYWYLIGSPTTSVCSSSGQYRDFIVDEGQLELLLRRENVL